MKKKDKIFVLSGLLMMFVLGSTPCAAEEKTGNGSKSVRELLIGSWHSESIDSNIKSDLYWHFNEDGTEQLISISDNDQIYPSDVSCGKWTVDGNTIKTVTLSQKEKNRNEWKILKINEDSLKIEYYDKQPKRFEASFKRINRKQP